MFELDDQAYIKRDYRELPNLCNAWGLETTSVQREVDAGFLPRAAYTIDGVGYFPDDLFVFPMPYSPLERKPAFIGRLRIAVNGAPFAEGPFLEEAWDDYISGALGVCLKMVLPETIARKMFLMAAIQEALNDPKPDDAHWRVELAQNVNALDALERLFAASDRQRFGGPVSRDKYVSEPRARFAL